MEVQGRVPIEDPMGGVMGIPRLDAMGDPGWVPEWAQWTHCPWGPIGLLEDPGWPY